MKLRALPLSLVLAGVFLLTGCREKTMPPEVAGIIRSTVESETLPASIKEQKERARAWEEMRRFYQKRQYQPAWSDVDGPRPHAEQLVQSIAAVAAAEGLDPRRYQSERLAGLLGQVKEQESLESPEAQRRLADLDVEMTFIYLMLAAHTAIGRVQPETLRMHWEDQSRNVDLDYRLEKALQEEGMAASLRSLAPPDPRYGRLRDALARYREIASRGGWPQVPGGLEKGSRGAGVIALRNRLTSEGDLPAVPEGRQDQQPSMVFDDAVAQAVARFQQRHGLEPDGKLGEDTLAEFNVPAQERVRQIEINLERWRWLPNSLGESYVWVNVPEFRMELYDEGRKAIDMAVVVGKQQSQTPVFSDQMEYLELNPEWNIPPSITEGEILPKLASDPGYLARNNMEWVGDGANQRLRQRPGPDNPLGQIKFMFPNEHDVYLHDTPADHLFAKEDRDFSHGCIRLERPVQLGEYLLRDDPDWRGGQLRQAIVAGEHRSVKLPKKLPVHILYFTAWVEDNGTVHFRKDVYGHDQKLAAALAEEPVVPLDLPALRGDVRAAR